MQNRFLTFFTPNMPIVESLLVPTWYLGRVDPGTRPILSLVPAPPFALRYAETLSIGVEAPGMVGAPGQRDTNTRTRMQQNIGTLVKKRRAF